MPSVDLGPGAPAVVPTPWHKRGLDLLLSGVGLILSAPLWLLFAVAVKLQDGGPVFFAQERIGEGGRIFKALKFRSMVPDAEAGVGAVQATEDDPRVTPVGRLLRAAAMDELPQLWNIFRGDMSFVGPRALRSGESDADRPGEVVSIEEEPGFAERCSIRPGLTGIAQIYADRDLPRRHKFRYDRLYIRVQSFWGDIGLVAALHRAAHHYGSNLLIWLHDVRLLVGPLADDARRLVVSLSRQKQLCAVTADAVHAACHRFDVPVPDFVHDLTDEPASTEPAVLFLDAAPSKAAVLWQDLRALPGWLSRARLLREHLFPPSAYIRQTYAVSNPVLVSLAYIHRIVTGIGPWFRGR